MKNFKIKKIVPVIIYIIIKALHRFLHGIKSVTSQRNAPKHQF
ncbi:hypothetical protein Avbf_06996 [Armadillidium vulgare]|nr:hypothetical protein Avbf_06996 [Armadillidium vulgare]